MFGVWVLEDLGNLACLIRTDLHPVPIHVLSVVFRSFSFEGHRAHRRRIHLSQVWISQEDPSIESQDVLFLFFFPNKSFSLPLGVDKRLGRDLFDAIEKGAVNAVWHFLRAAAKSVGERNREGWNYMLPHSHGSGKRVLLKNA